MHCRAALLPLAVLLVDLTTAQHHHHHSHLPAALNASTITLFHVNQKNYSGITNMDLGDAAGDALFDLRTPLQYYECTQLQHEHPHYPRQCDNPEEFASNLVISKVQVHWDRQPGVYSRCNLCDNGITPFAPPPSANTCGSFR